MCVTSETPNRIFRQRGASLLSAVFLITALAVLAALMTRLIQFGSTSSVKEWNAAQALYAAESAVSAAAYDILQNDNCSPRNNIAVTIGSDTSASYSVNCTQPGLSGVTLNLYEIIATGTSGSGSHQVQRRLRVQFMP